MFELMDAFSQNAVIKVMGVGGGGGNAVQSNQAAEQLTAMMGWESGSSGFVIGVVLAIVVGIVIIGGIKRIASVTEKIVPFMAVIYALACLVVIFANFSYILPSHSCCEIAHRPR